MPNTAANIVSGAPAPTGAVYFGPLTAVLPTNATSTLTGFVLGGYVGDSGLEESPERSVDKKKAWGGDTVKVVQTEFGVTYKFTFLETLNAEVLKTVYGDSNVTTTAATTTTSQLHEVKVTGQLLPHKKFIFEMRDGYAKTRICVPDGQIIEVSPIQYSDEELVGYEVTVEALPDVNGVYSYKYFDNGLKSDGTPVV